MPPREDKSENIGCLHFAKQALPSWGNPRPKTGLSMMAQGMISKVGVRPAQPGLDREVTSLSLR